MNSSFLSGTDLLLTYEEIRMVKSRYCRLIDTKQWEALKDVFAPDAVADFSTEGNPIPVLEGRDTIVRVFEDLVDPAVTVHQVHSADIELLSATEARVLSPMEDYVTFPEGSAHKSFHGYGYYHETFIQLEGRWYIKHTRLERLRLDIL
ncbi:nuclear transport factor 2 family protein [Paenibacillus dauci]|uniref:nuclear transport factor 2 family protein n=1 Tax=Paenibacillus dauci TaxID=1567106 RepID=UPI000619E59C|nr:nuclear transport factor 2 family protein [Paenibacillus dauci]